jgi:phosphoglycerate dehydrogenase-like enzyme
MKTGIFQMVRGGAARFSPYAERWEDLELIGFDCPPTMTHDNFIFTPHSAFYTDEAERNLTEGTIRNLVSYMRTGVCENELIQR